jgi:hypothetical protein
MFVNDTSGGGCAQILVMVLPLQANIGEYDAVWYPPNGATNPYVFSSLTGGPYPIESWSTTQLSYGGVVYNVPPGSGAWLVSAGGGAGACNTATGTTQAAWGWISQPTQVTISGNVQGCHTLSGPSGRPPLPGELGGVSVDVSGTGPLATRMDFATTTDQSGHYSAMVPEGQYLVMAFRRPDIRRLSQTYFSFTPANPLVDATGGNAAQNFCMYVTTVKFADTAPVNPPPAFWSSPAGQAALKQWAFAESAGAYAAKVSLEAAKSIKDAAAAGTVLASDVQFLVTKANPYLGAVSAGLTGGALLDAGFAYIADPFDSHYKVVAKPKAGRAPSVSVSNPQDQRMLNSFLGNMENLHAVGVALRTTENRAASARKVGDKQAYKLQEQAISRYLEKLANLSDRQIASQMAIERVLRNMLQAAGIGQVSLGSVPTSLYGAEVASDPLTLEQARVLSSFGATSSYVAKVENAVANASIPTSIDLLSAIVNPTMIRDERTVAAILRAEALRIPK